MRIASLSLVIGLLILTSCGTKNTETSATDTLASEDSIDVQTALTADGPELEIEEEVTSPMGTDEMLNASNESEVRAGIKGGGRVNSGLLYACNNRNPKLVEELIDAGADRGVALFWAVEFENVEITKALVAQGAKMGNSVLEEMRYLVYNMNREDLRSHWTETGGFSKIAYSGNDALKELVVGAIDGKMYSEVFEDGESPGRANSDFIEAASRGEIAVIEFMIRVGADPNAVTPYGNSALGEAEANSHPDMVELLKKHGAKKQ